MPLATYLCFSAQLILLYCMYLCGLHGCMLNACMFVHTCEHMYMSGYACVWIYRHMYGCESADWRLMQLSSSISLHPQQGLLPNQKFTNSARLASWAAWWSPYTCLSSAGIAGRPPYLCSMHTSAEFSKSIPHPHTAIPLSTEPSPQPSNGI